MRLRVEPIYGWGWFYRREKESLSPPPEFVMEAEVALNGAPFRVARGRVSIAGHLLDGLWILLTSRHEPYDGHCNLQAFMDKPILSEYPPQPPQFSGYAIVSEISK
jgi:hypothetical protein